MPVRARGIARLILINAPEERLAEAGRPGRPSRLLTRAPGDGHDHRNRSEVRKGAEELRGDPPALRLCHVPDGLKRAEQVGTEDQRPWPPPGEDDDRQRDPTNDADRSDAGSAERQHIIRNAERVGASEVIPGDWHRMTAGLKPQNAPRTKPAKSKPAKSKAPKAAKSKSKPKAARESTRFHVELREADVRKTGSAYEATVIREGPGNPEDKNAYSHQALRRAVSEAYVVNGLSLDQHYGVHLMGAGPAMQYQTGPTTLLFTQASGHLLTMYSTINCEVSNIQFHYNNASYTGNLIDIDGSIHAADCQNNHIHHCSSKNLAASRTANSIIRLNQCVINQIDHSVRSRARAARASVSAILAACTSTCRSSKNAASTSTMAATSWSAPRTASR